MKSISALLPIVLICCSGCSSESSVAVEPEFRDRDCTFDTVVERTFANSFEEQLIEKAEQYYPLRDSVVSLAEQFGVSSDSIPSNDYWWYQIYRGIRVPYAITSEAIEYFVESVKIVERNTREVCKNYSYSAQYVATVRFERTYTVQPMVIGGESKSFENVYVVTMSLTWGSSYHGPGLGDAYGVRADRLVVFDEQGIMLGVFYDGGAGIAVS